MQPDSRLCQIIVNNFSADPYYVEDDVVEEELDKILKGWDVWSRKAKTQGESSNLSISVRTLTKPC